jgi:hypothetical protein
VLNGLARRLVSDTEFRIANPTCAVRMGEQAVRFAPKSEGAWNTLGMARYCAGDCKAAIEALEKSEGLAPGVSLADNSLFLAMAHWQLGRKRGN